MKQFFMPMIPPTITAQEKCVTIHCGKPHFYDPPELKAAKEKFMANLAKHKISEPLGGAIRLTTKWCFPIRGEHKDGEYKTSKPDTDNSIKLLKDCMTKSGFWKDDAQVASEITEKFWANIPGIFVKIEELN